VTGVLAAVPGPVAQLVSGAALVAGVLTVAATRRPALALSVFLDLLTAAGLLRLVGDPSWQSIATAATIVPLRHLIGLGLRIGARSWTSPTTVTGPDRTDHDRTGTAGRGRATLELAVDRLLRPAWWR
jgi:hypothetical protein